jgi:hypothetical protein
LARWRGAFVVLLSIRSLFSTCITSWHLTPPYHLSAPPSLHRVRKAELTCSMPRRSLAASSSTPTTRPKRPAPSPVSEPHTRKRRRRGFTPTPPAEDAESPGINGEAIAAAPVSVVLAADAAAAGDSGEVYDSEKELEAWQDFAAEHYEMVEQLPLELHRNFRLLRELDDGCIGESIRVAIDSERSVEPGRTQADVLCQPKQSVCRR